MPRYQFECTECGYRWIVHKGFNEPDPTMCPKCGGPAEKVIPQPAIKFNGEGFTQSFIPGGDSE
jgi:putative FmdB family regulatory protein